MQRNTFNILVFLALCFGALSCNKAELQILYAKQQSNIDKYIDAQKRADENLLVERLGGVYRITRTAGMDGKLAQGGELTLLYAAYTFNSASGVGASSLFATNDAEIATAANFKINEDSFGELTVDYPGDLIEGLVLGLEGVQNGGEYEIIFTGKYGLGGKQLGIVPANSALLYRIWVKEVK